MELVVQGFGKEYVIEVGVDDTTETMRQKVASAAGLAEDSFHMGFGGKEEGDDIRELSAGSTVVLTKTPKYEAIAELHALGETDITIETLQRVRDPRVASLLLQAEVTTAIPDDFLSDQSAVTRIVFSPMSDVDDNCGTLHLPALPSVTAVGDYFLFSTNRLSTVDLSGLHAVTTIGDSFLGCCPLLKLDLSGCLHAVTTIGDEFLGGCARLSTVDLSGLQAVTTIGGHFLCHCDKLSTVDLSGLRAVTTIGDGFLYGCRSLSTVDVTSLQAVTAIGGQFLDECAALQTVHGKEKCSHVVREAVGTIATRKKRRTV